MLARKNPDHFKPSHGKLKFTDIDFAALHAQGINYLIIDVDNTLAVHKGPQVEPQVLAHLQAAVAAGYIKGFCLLSNAIIPKKSRRARLKAIAEQAGTDKLFLATIWTHLKPHPNPYRKALALLGNPNPSTVLMIGDQLFTDVLGANRLGIHSLMVEPLGEDPFYITWKRRREKKYNL